LPSEGQRNVAIRVRTAVLLTASPRVLSCAVINMKLAEL